MSSNRVVNIINFIRAVEPRCDIDLLGTVEREVDLVNSHSLPATWLMQYDALVSDDYIRLLKSKLRPDNEVGVWVETVQPLVEKAGLKWRGRYPWDWHADTGFSVGYSPEDRRRMTDIFMGDFKAVWGYYPKVMGSWFFDAVLLDYMRSKYGVEAACNCRDQHGTDGYTLWGGYWANAYYPSKLNSFMPAQRLEDQIDVPVFRMLGSDPVYQYSVPADSNGQKVITLEPVYTDCGGLKCGGGDPDWVRWFFKTVFTSPDLAMSYAQAGQENSFGWGAIEIGLRDQLNLISEWRAAGKIRVETLGETGAWFRKSFSLTPVSAVTALDDWMGEGRGSVWFMSRFQRLNFYCDKGELWIRDWRLFSSLYKERFLDAVCRTHSCVYDTPPLMDSYLWGSSENTAGIRLAGCGKGSFGAVRELSAGALEIEWLSSAGRALFTAGEEGLKVELPPGGRLEFEYDPGRLGATSFRIKDSRALEFRHEGFSYLLKIESGTLCLSNAEKPLICPENSLIALAPSSTENK